MVTSSWAVAPGVARATSRPMRAAMWGAWTMAASCTLARTTGTPRSGAWRRAGSIAQPGTGAGVTDRGRSAQSPGAPLQHRVERREQGRVGLGQRARRERTRGVGTGRHERAREATTEFGHRRVRADPDRQAVVVAGDPARHAGGGGHHPGVRARPGCEYGAAGRIRKYRPVDKAFDLGGVGGDEDQALANRALLERQQAHDRGLVERIAAEPPDRLGRVRDDATAAERGHGGFDVE